MHLRARRLGAPALGRLGRAGSWVDRVSNDVAQKDDRLPENPDPSCYSGEFPDPAKDLAGERLQLFVCLELLEPACTR